MTYNGLRDKDQRLLANQFDFGIDLHNGLYTS